MTIHINTAILFKYIFYPVTAVLSIINHSHDSVNTKQTQFSAETLKQQYMFALFAKTVVVHLHGRFDAVAVVVFCE